MGKGEKQVASNPFFPHFIPIDIFLTMSERKEVAATLLLLLLLPTK